MPLYSWELIATQQPTLIMPMLHINPKGGFAGSHVIMELSFLPPPVRKWPVWISSTCQMLRKGNITKDKSETLTCSVQRGYFFSPWLKPYSSLLNFIAWLRGKEELITLNCFNLERPRTLMKHFIHLKFILCELGFTLASGYLHTQRYFGFKIGILRIYWWIIDVISCKESFFPLPFTVGFVCLSWGSLAFRTLMFEALVK